MTTPKTYKTLIEGTLVQTTALSVGGNDPHAMADAPLARDGRDRLILRGTGLAGAFISTARAIIDGDLPARVTAGTPGEQAAGRAKLSKDESIDRLFESVWRFYPSHPEDPRVEPEIRTGVGIRQDTAAAAEGIKFDTETIPAGTRWPFLLEIDEYRDTSAGLALPIALRTLREWERHRCFLGRDLARGLGWCSLEDVRVYRLKPEDADIWPDAWKEPLKAIAHIRDNRGERLLADRGRSLEKNDRIKRKTRHIRSGTCTIQVGLDIPRGDDGDHAPWGLDALSLGGGDAMLGMQDAALAGALDRLPKDKDDNPPEPDLVLAWTRPQGKPTAAPRPFLPGSGLRGPLRHTLAWWERRNGSREPIVDPNTPAGQRQTLVKDRPDSAVDRLFGTARHSAALLLSDALLDGPDPTREAGLWFIEQHAEDEFTASTCGSQKFNRLALIKGRFRFHYFIETLDHNDLKTFDALLETLQRLGEQQQIPIGGGQWRGHGWIRWHWQPDEPNDAKGGAQ